MSATAATIFRGERVGTIYGTISIGSGLGSWSAGLIHDWTRSYNLLFAFALVVSMLLRSRGDVR